VKTLKDTVAVITGAASGIGYALTCEALKRGARVVMADIREDALKDAAKDMPADSILTVVTDVADAKAVEALADAAVRRFGKVNLVVNNAGVFASGLTWEVSAAEYDWVIAVNQRSVINGIRAFVPRMIAQKDDCHVVSIASGAGITVNPGFASYSMTKHAVVALTEALYLDLQAQGIANVGVTLVMPGMVQSKIMYPEKTGPAALQGELAARHDNATLKALETLMRGGVDAGLPAATLAEHVFDAVERDDLYVLPAFMDDASQAQARAIALGRATAQNPYPTLLEPFLAQLRAPTTSG
jgi:NADP-dependent 3-hydroxy acid dehydrogenase YdfG